MVWNPFTRRSRLVAAQLHQKAAESEAAFCRKHLIVSRDAIRWALSEPSISERTRDKLLAALGNFRMPEELVGGTIHAGKITSSVFTSEMLVRGSITADQLKTNTPPDESSQ